MVVSYYLQQQQEDDIEEEERNETLHQTTYKNFACPIMTCLHLSFNFAKSSIALFNCLVTLTQSHIIVISNLTMICNRCLRKNTILSQKLQFCQKIPS